MLSELVVVFGLSAFVGGLISCIYLVHSSITKYTKSFTFTLALVVMLMAVILNSVGSNIAASISLFGALSLLRFRSVVQSSDDMAFLLASVAAGLVIGTQNYWLIIPVISILVILVLIYKKVKIKKVQELQYVNVIYHRYVSIETILDVLKFEGFNDLNIQSKSIKSGVDEVNLLVKCFGTPGETLKVVEIISKISGVIKVKVFSDDFRRG